jgi:hypothetical protein
MRSLSGNVKADLTSSTTVYPPDPGCTGTVTETQVKVKRVR